MQRQGEHNCHKNQCAQKTQACQTDTDSIFASNRGELRGSLHYKRTAPMAAQVTKLVAVVRELCFETLAFR